MAAGSKPNEIHITRVYDAPLSAVWQAWSDPAELAQWWGPRGFTITTHSRDLRSGGHWHYTMHGPEGTDYENTTRYLEVVPGQRMVYDHGGHGDRPPLFRVTVMFTERAGRTRLDLTMALATAEAAAEARQFIRKAGGDATWDRLGEHVAKRSEGRELFLISRSFEADIETVYAMWTEPSHLARWLPPVGASMQFRQAEPRVGGTSLYAMSLPDGSLVHGILRYVALQPPHRLVYTQQFCDAAGQIERPHFFPHWPPTMLTTVELEQEAPGRTRVTVRWEPQADAGTDDVAEFARQRGSMTGGFDSFFN